MIKVNSGKSDKDRISFFTKNRGVAAIRNENGEIDIETANKSKDIWKSLLALFVIFIIFALIKAYIIIPLIEKGSIGIGWYFVSTLFMLALTIFSIVYVRKTEGKEFLKNHGAEHKVHTAYVKLKRIPTIEEAKRFSRIHKSCGITLYSAFITVQIIGFVVYITTGYVISEIVLFLVPLCFHSRFPINLLGKLAQFFTTSQPEDENIELAIAAISALEKREMLFGDIRKLIGVGD